MGAIWKRELKSYFGGLYGFGMIAIQLLAAGILSTSVHILMSSSNFSAIFGTLPLLLVPLLPLLATVSCTRDHQSGNLPWLYTLPIRRSSVLLGKYFAALTLFLIPTLCLAILPPLLALFGTVSYGSAYLSLLGYALGGAALLALCMCVASAMRNRFLAWLFGTLLCLALYLMPILVTVFELLPIAGLAVFALAAIAVGVVLGLRRKKWLLGVLTALIPCAVSVLLYLLLPQSFAEILHSVSVFAQIDKLHGGHLELPAMVLLISFAVFFLFLMLYHSKKPTCAPKKRGLTARHLALVRMVLILFAVNILLPLLPFRVIYANASGNTVYQISDTTKRYLSGINEPVEIIFNSEGGRSQADRDLYAFVLQFADANPKIKVSCRNIQNYDGGVEHNSITVRSPKRSRSFLSSELFYYYSSTTGMTFSVNEYAALLSNLQSMSGSESYQSMLQLYGPGTISAYFTGDANLCGAIRYVLADSAPAIYSYATEKSGSMNALLLQQLQQCGYPITALSDLREIPDDCAALYLTVTEDINENDAAVLSSYLSGGGKLLLTTSYANPNRPNLASLLSAYGLSEATEQNIIYTVSDSQLSPMFSAVMGDHPACDRLTGSAVGTYAHAIQISEKAGVTQTPLMMSPSGSYLIHQNQTEEPTAGSYTVGVSAEVGDATLVWISMTMDSLSNGLSGGVNFDLVTALIGDMTGAGLSAMSIADRVLPAEILAASDTVLIVWIILFVLLIPGGLVAVGAIRKYARKKMA